MRVNAVLAFLRGPLGFLNGFWVRVHGGCISGADGNEMEQRVLTRLRKDFQVGSAEWNDVAFTRQRVRWTQDSQNGPYIEVTQNKAIDELEEIPAERNTKDDLHALLRCTQCTEAYWDR